MPRAVPGDDTPLSELKADLFKALGHPVRIRTLELLAEGERPVSQLLAETRTEASNLSQHLSVLRRAGVVAARREGNGVHYRLADPSVPALLAAAHTVLLRALGATRDALADLEQDVARAPASPGSRRPGSA